MPNCVVKGCSNHSSKNKKQDGITFHMFPNRNQDIREKWIELVRVSRNEPSWNPSLRSVVCSKHFECDDFYTTNKGFRRVVRNSYPKLITGTQNLSANMAEPATIYTQLLATHIKIEHIKIDEDLIQPHDSQALIQLPATTIKSEPVEIDVDLIQLSFSQDQLPATPIKSEPIEIVENPIQRCSLRAHAPATPIKSHNIDLIQPCTVQNHAPATPIESHNIDLIQPCTVQNHAPATPIESHNIDLIQPCTVQNHVSTTPSSTSSSPIQNMEDENESIFDTPRKHKLRQRVFRLQNKQKQMRRKIKTLYQKIRRLTKRNKSLNEILKKFKKDSMIILKSNNSKATKITDIS